MTALLIRVRRAGIALLACAVLAPGVSGCGSNDERPTSANPSKPGGKPSATPTPKPSGGSYSY